MKKGNRILALFLAITLVITGITWDFSSTNVSAEGSESTKSSLPETIDFKNIDLATLDDLGFTSTKYNRNKSYAVVGKTEQQVSNHWFSGNGTSTPYTTNKSAKIWYSDKTTGIKPTAIDSDGTATILNTPYTYENFIASADIRNGYTMGFVLGPKNTWPSATSNGIFVYFANGRVQMSGALDYNDILEKSGTWGISGTTGCLMAQKTLSTNKTYTLNVQMVDDVLTVWVTGFSDYVSVKVKDNYQAGNIGLTGRKFDTDGGGIEYLEINQLADDEVSFQNANLTILDELGFTSTKFNRKNNNALVGDAEQKVSNHWFTGNGTDTPYTTNESAKIWYSKKTTGIKPIDIDSSSTSTVLNTPYTYENYKMSVDIRYGYAVGVVLGQKNVFPVSHAEVIAIYFANGLVQMTGPLDYAGATATGTWQNKGTYGNLMKQNTLKANSTYTLNVQMESGVLTVWVDGFDDRVVLNVTDEFVEGNIGLIARKFDTDGGGIESITIKELAKKPAVQAQPGEGFNKQFLPSSESFNVTSLNKDFSSYYFASSTATGERGRVSERWNYSNKTGEGLKPKHNGQSGARTMLTYDKLIFKNVEVTTKYAINWVDYSVMIAPQGQMASVGNNGIKAWVESDGKIRVTGAIDAGTATATGGYVQVLGQNMIRGYKITDYSSKKVDGYYTLHVKIDNGMLHIWMDEIPDYVISVKVTEDYQGGLVSLYSTGNNSGGFGAFSAVELTATTPTAPSYEQSFNTIDSLNELSDFTAYQLDSVENKPQEVKIADTFRLKSGRLQSISPKNGSKERTNFSILTLNKKSYENFELTLHYEQSRMQRYGIMFGTELGEFAYSEVDSKLVANGGAFVYTEAEGYRNVRGSMWASSYTKAAELQSRKASKLDSFWWVNNKEVMNTVQQKSLHTMTIRVEDGYMTMVIDNDETSELKVCLRDYEGGYISLVSDSAENEYGGFTYLSITELPATQEQTPVQPEMAQIGEGFGEDFTTSDFKVSDLNDEFDGYYFETSEAEAIRLDPTVLWSDTANGLKPYHKDTDGERTVLTYKERSFKNVDISAKYQRNWVQYGIMIAPVAELATVENNGIKVWVESEGTVKITGAIDAGSASATGGCVKINGNSNSLAGFKITDYADKATDKFYNLHVKVDGKVLSVWMDEFPEYVITLNVTDDYQGGVVSLYATGNQSGGWGTFIATEIEPEQPDTEVYTQSFSAIDSLDELTDFTAYSLETVKDTPQQVEIDEAFRLKKGRMQATSPANGERERTNWSILTLNNKTYKNFEMTVHFEQSRMQRYGVMFGTELGEFAYTEVGSRLQSNGGTLVYTEAEGYRNVKSLMYSSFYTNGMELLHRDKGDSKLDSFWSVKNDVDASVKQKVLHTMTIRVVGEYMTMIVDNDESSRVTVRLADYNGGYVSLVSNSAANEYGAFAYMSIKELSEDASLEAEKPQVSDGYETLKNLEEDFDAYYLTDAKESSKMKKVNMKEHWWIGDDEFIARTTNSTGYSVEQDVEVLTYTKQKFTDFELTYTYHQNWLRLGVVIGEDMGEYPLSYVNGRLTADKGAVVFFEAEGRTNVKGHLNNLTKTDELLYRITKVPDGFLDGAGKADGNIGKEHTVKIVVKDKQLYAFLDGSAEPVVYVHLGDNYQGGYISMFSHAGNAYGFSDFKVTDKVTTALPKGGGTSVSGNTFTADFNSVRFDTSAFTTYYLAKTKGNADGTMEKQNFEDQWTIDNGVLESNTKLTTPSAKNLTEFEWDDSTMVSVLTYNKKLTDFVVSYDYTKTWYRSMFMFGTEMGKFALAAPNTTQHGQGVLIYPENDLGAGGGLVALGSLATYTNSMRPMNRTLVKVADYHEKGKWNSNVGDMHTMTVAVINGHCYIYLDDYGMIADYELENYEGGYVSLATSGRNYQYFGVNFDNLRITDLSTLSENDIIAGENPSDITVLVGTDASALGLPTSVKATTKTGKTVDVPVTWKSLNYNPNEAGVYQFTAVLDNKTNVGVKINIRVVTEMPKTQSGVKYWTFDTEEDLKDFKAYYLKNADSGYITEDVPNWYVSSSGKLTRDPFRAVNGDQYKELAILTYAKEKYTNFELEVEYTQQWQRMMVMFGSEKVGQYIDLKDIYAASNPVAGFVEMEGTRNFIGNLINANFDSNDKEKINNARESGIRLDGYYDKVLSGGNQGKSHTMKIRVVGDQAMMWIDNAEVPYVCTLTNYDGGYISLVTTSKNGSFDNLKITRLGATPEEVVKEPNAVANGTMNVSIDAAASTELVVPEKVKPESYEDILIGGDKEVVIPTIAYVVGGSTILLAIIVGSLFILAALKKKKKEN